MISALAELDRGRAIEHLSERVRTNPSGALWALYGSQLSSAGRSEAAADAYYRAWQFAPGDGYQYHALQLDPARFTLEFVQQAQAHNNDELFGDIADALWQVGRREDARAYWQRAHEIDRNDSEWSFKLRELAAGRDPVR